MPSGNGLTVISSDGRKDEFPELEQWIVNGERCLNLYDGKGNVVVMYNAEHWARVCSMGHLPKEGDPRIPLIA